MTRNVYNGKCRLCRTFFVGMSKSEYTHAVTRHIRGTHPDVDVDTEVVEPV